MHDERLNCGRAVYEHHANTYVWFPAMEGNTDFQTGGNVANIYANVEPTVK